MSQLLALYEALQDKKPHSNFELVGEVYHFKGPSIARLGARIFDLKRKYGLDIQGWKDTSDPRKYWYQLNKKVIS